MMRHLAGLLCALWLACALTAQSEQYKEFVDRLSKAVEYDDSDGMDRAIKREPGLAMSHFIATCWQYRARPDEKAKKTIDAMKASWQRAFGVDSLDKVERYVSSRTESDRSLLVELESKEPPIFALFNEGKQAKDRGLLEQARDAATELARRYEEVGHAANAAKMWGLASQISNEMPSKTLEDRRAAVQNVREFLRTRDMWSFSQDEHYLRNQNWAEAEEKLLASMEKAAGSGGGEGGAAGGGGSLESALAPGAAEEVAELKFEAIDKPHTDMFASGGVIPPLWAYAQVGPTPYPTGPTPFPRLQPAVYLVRPSPNKYGITTDGAEADMKKNEWQEISPSTKFKPSVFYRGPDRTRPYAMWFYTAGEQEPLLGMSQNLMPQPDRATIYYKSAASWVATINGEEVTFYDDNANGQLFEQDPYAYGLFDRSRGDPKSGVPVPAYDSMRVGREPVQPLSGVAKIGDRWFLLQMQGEDKVTARPLAADAFKVGKVEMKWQGPRAAKPELLVIQGLEGLAQARYDISSGEEVEVPAGVYEIAFGRIVTGKPPRADQANVFKGSSQPITVQAGETAVVQLGAPFKLDFVRGGDKGTVEIDATKISVIGAAGEQYARITVPPTPEVLVAKNADGRGARPIGEFVPMDIDNLEKAAQKLQIGADTGFYPVPKGEHDGNLVLKAEVPAEGGVVGLRQKKHKIFGSLEPIFK